MAQPHPALVVAGLVVMTVVAASLTAWCWAVAKLTLRQPLIVWSERRAVPWGAVGLIVGLSLPGLGLALSVLQYLAGDSTPPPKLTLSQQTQIIVWTGMLIPLAVVGMTASFLVFVNRATATDLGWSPRHWFGDLRLGIVAFVMLAPPVYLIQGLLVYFWKPSQHPLMEMFKATPETTFFAVLFLTAAVAAPLFEEFVFRVLLQGFLEKLIGCRGLPLEEYIAGAGRTRSTKTVIPISQIAVVTSTNDNPYASPALVELNLPNTPAISSPQEMSPLRGLRAVLPITISSLIFALLHYSHGPDWVPLLLLAAGMGYLYQRTHRIVPSLVVHALLNSFSMAGLWIQVYVMPEVEGVHGSLFLVLCCILGSNPHFSPRGRVLSWLLGRWP